MEPVHDSPKSNVLRVGFTLNIKEGMLAEYKMHHDNSRPEIVKALHAVGMRNLSLWCWENRLFYYAEYVGTEPFDVAMEKYAKMPGVQEWEHLMHQYQEKLPGTDTNTDVWWQQCTQVYHQE